MTRAIGMLVGTLLMLGLFLLVLSAADAPTLPREVVNSGAATSPVDAVIAPAREVPVEQSVDSPAPGVTDIAGLALENQPVSANKEFNTSSTFCFLMLTETSRSASISFPLYIK